MRPAPGARGPPRARSATPVTPDGGRSWTRPRGDVRLLVGGMPGLDVARARSLGVELCAEQDREGRGPHPDEDRDPPAERAVRLVVRAEARDVEREGGRRGDPQDDGEDAAGEHGADARLLDV